MKKHVLHLVRCAALSLVLLFPQQLIRSQIADPSTWETFVEENEGVLVMDTFRRQTFSGLPTDNWTYTSAYDLSIVDITNETEISGNMGSDALKIPVGTEVSFEHYAIDRYSIYDTVLIRVNKAGKNLMKGENLKVRAYRWYDKEDSLPNLLVVNKDNYTSSKFTITNVLNNSPGIDIIALKSSNSNNGYFYIDSIYAFGEQPAYSLFTGSGSWERDTLCWSHLPAYRFRTALIKGDVTLDGYTLCNQVHLGEGSIEIASDGDLVVDQLTIYANDNAATYPSLLSAGEIHVDEYICVEKTFTEKGKWYFISFPFDVYPSGIDSAFRLSDDTENLSGNYFYLQSYDGDRRASLESSSGNWTVVSKNISDSKPVMEKNKGYLIALDAAASRQSIRFSSKQSNIPTDFAKNGEASIQVTINTQSQNDDHNGWYLCGNPLPASLPLRQIEDNPDLDGYIYMYDGTEYMSYALAGKYAVPAYSAFFVKASKNTTLSIHQATTSTTDYELIKTGQPMSEHSLDPQAVGTPTTNESLSPTGISYRLIGKTLFLERLPVKGEIQVFDPVGRLVFTQSVEPGSSTISLPLPSGLYILSIRSGSEQVKGKHLL